LIDGDRKFDGNPKIGSGAKLGYHFRAKAIPDFRRNVA